jgi:hypothetical protein
MVGYITPYLIAPGQIKYSQKTLPWWNTPAIYEILLYPSTSEDIHEPTDLNIEKRFVSET